jgi:hypothetical protein
MNISRSGDRIAMPTRRHSILCGALPVVAGLALALPGHAAEPACQVIHTRYEAADPRIGGHFIIWLDREKVWHGLDPRLYPAVKYVDVTHLTPSPGSPPITVIEVTSVNSTVPEYYHLTGLARFKVTGMIIKSTTIP